MGNRLRHGVDVYKQTINMKNEPPPENSSKRKFDEGLLKTGTKGFQSKELQFKELQSKELQFKGLQSPDSKYRRVAKFLILIGSDQAAEILAELDSEQVEAISKEIALVKTIKPEEGQEILDEFHSLFSRPYRFSGLSRGGIETARRILYAAKGAEKGEVILNKAVPESKENLFSFLEEFSPEQLIMLLKNETAQTTALVLSRLPAKISANILSKLPPERKPEVLKFIAKQGEISPEVLEQVTAALRDKARNVSAGANDIEIDGMQALAAILKQGDYSFGDRIVNELERNSPDISKDLKEKLYTLEDVVNTVDRPIQERLAAMQEQDIALLLKGKDHAFSEKILSCVSAGRRQLIREESEILGAVPKRDCDAATGEFLAWFRRARENGEIILYTDEDVFV